MWPYFDQQNNPYVRPMPTAPMPTPTQVTRVNGRNGAEALPMSANSSALPLDTSGTMVWLITTDGAGYKTITPYDITPHQDAEAKSLADIEARLTRLEGLIHDTENPSAT